MGRRERNFMKKTAEKADLKNLKVEKKLEKSFSKLLRAFIVAIVIALAGIAMINMNLNRFYNESYKNMQRQLEIRRDVQLVGKNVLWAITATENQEEKINDAVEYAQRVEENVLALEESFSDKEMTAALDEALKALKAERLEVVELVTAGENEKALELFNGTYDEATENIQNVLIEIGDAADAQAATAYSRASSLVTIIVVVLVVVGVISLVMCKKTEKTLTALLLEPIEELQGTAKMLKAGELDTDINYTSQDELGDLANNFREACMQMQTVIKDMEYLLMEMADGNFNIHTSAEEHYVGEFAILIDNIRKMNRGLNSTLKQINQTAGQVMVGSEQLADSAQSLAEGATEQAGAVQQLMATVGNVASIAQDSAQGSAEAAKSAKLSAENAGKSREEMNALTEAMERINVTSREIENIIAAIEDIASQTNLLSLNASIEAARAGEAGKGFAVVADQIGKLATDSAQSAVSTRELISKSLEEVEKGNQIVEHTMEAIGTVLASMEQFAKMASESAVSSKEQAELVRQIEVGIQQISSVVENNSAVAQQTSAISEELSTQAKSLEQMIAAFELRES